MRSRGMPCLTTYDKISNKQADVGTLLAYFYKHPPIQYTEWTIGAVDRGKIDKVKS